MSDDVYSKATFDGAMGHDFDALMAIVEENFDGNSISIGLFEYLPLTLTIIVSVGGPNATSWLDTLVSDFTKAVPLDHDKTVETKETSKCVTKDDVAT